MNAYRRTERKTRFWGIANQYSRPQSIAFNTPEMVSYAAYRHEHGKAHGNRSKSAAGEVFGCIPHGARAYHGIDLREIRKYKKKGVRR
jgi:hypothetical protein